MENIFTDQLIKLLSISSTLSIITMGIIQHIKSTWFIKKESHIWIINLLISIFFGIPFTIYFYNLPILDSIWVALFTLVGAPSIYVTLKEQNLINYTPKSLKSNDTKNIKNEVFTKRDF